MDPTRESTQTNAEEKHSQTTGIMPSTLELRFLQGKYVLAFLPYTRHGEAARGLVPTLKEFIVSLFTKTMTTLTPGR